MDTAASQSSSSSIMFYDFLDKMRNPAALNLVKSIKSFIVSFQFSSANPENDSKRVQEFFSTMEAAIMEHPLWAGATDDEFDCSMEGLEKYIMTKLFSRTFAISPEDVKTDQEISEKIHLLQSFLRPEHLDIPPFLQNEASWLLAEKELQKINAFRAPREKLHCIMSCCRIINNLLLNASMSENHVLGGADDFLPVLIYVTIKANPPQLHSNLKYIQLYRRQEKMVSEPAYYFTNLVSAKSFIGQLDAKSLSMDEIEFEESMQAAKLDSKVSQVEASQAQTDPIFSTRMHGMKTNIDGRSNYPYMEAEPGELTVEDVERLLSLYKDVVTKYSSLCRAVRHPSATRTEPSLPVPKGRDDILLQLEGQAQMIREEKAEVHKVKSFPVKRISAELSIPAHLVYCQTLQVSDTTKGC
ncbi:vacuolar protein sorting-associated protein 9A-like isoform X2 [Populus nigra]|uniref:vacuolar protein sorting-associated protein 9A-like isoform X2 n=1 Tax=Populus nigra TaxID=3691 RepID=UPI002B279DA3|nr:vacuolar protein sorting-associated protein 9A-like isoform X2 [Populus nigra]